MTDLRPTVHNPGASVTVICAGDGGGEARVQGYRQAGEGGG